MIVLTGLRPECSAIHLRQVFRGNAVLPRFRGGGEQRFHGLAGSLVGGIQLLLPAFAFLRPKMGIGGTNRKPEDTKSPLRIASIAGDLSVWGQRKRNGIPLCFMIAFAVCRDLIFPSTVMYRFVAGLYQIS